MKSVEAQFEKIVVAKAKGAGEQTANLAMIPSIFPLVKPVW